MRTFDSQAGRMALAVFGMGVFLACAGAVIADERGRNVDVPLIDMGDGTKGQRVECISTPLKGSAVIDARTLALYDLEGNVGVLRLSGPCLKDMRKSNPWITVELDTHADHLCRKYDFRGVISMENRDLTCAVTKFEAVHLAEVRD